MTFTDIHQSRKLPEEEKCEIIKVLEHELEVKLEEYNDRNEQLKNSVKDTSLKELNAVFEYVNSLKKEIENREFFLTKLAEQLQAGDDNTSELYEVARSISGAGVVNIRPDDKKNR